jgi:hypothetical protein
MQTPTPTAPASAPSPVRAYLLAALLLPPLGMKLGWQMPGQPLAVRLLLCILPALPPVLGMLFVLPNLG